MDVKSQGRKKKATWIKGKDIGTFKMRIFHKLIMGMDTNQVAYHVRETERVKLYGRGAQTFWSVRVVK